MRLYTVVEYDPSLDRPLETWCEAYLTLERARGVCQHALDEFRREAGQNPEPITWIAESTWQHYGYEDRDDPEAKWFVVSEVTVAYGDKTDTA